MSRRRATDFPNPLERSTKTAPASPTHHYKRGSRGAGNTPRRVRHRSAEPRAHAMHVTDVAGSVCKPSYRAYRRRCEFAPRPECAWCIIRQRGPVLHAVRPVSRATWQGTRDGVPQPSSPHSRRTGRTSERRTPRPRPRLRIGTVPCGPCPSWHRRDPRKRSLPALTHRSAPRNAVVSPLRPWGAPCDAAFRDYRDNRLGPRALRTNRPCSCSFGQVRMPVVMHRQTP